MFSQLFSILSMIVHNRQGALKAPTAEITGHMTTHTKYSTQQHICNLIYRYHYHYPVSRTLPPALCITLPGLAGREWILCPVLGWKLLSFSRLRGNSSKLLEVCVFGFPDFLSV
jgi:hypothetical protein